MEKKYNWAVSVNAPKNCPATLHYGYLGPVEIRGKGTLDSGWGLGGSITGFGKQKALPKQLDIVWISYLENQFYEGHFKLDQKKLQDVFEKGFKERRSGEIINSHNLNFRINVAPGGLVAIWVIGTNGFQREIGYYQAKKTEVVWKEYNPYGEQDRQKSVKMYVDRIAPEVLELYKKNKDSLFNTWKTYRQPYTWRISIQNNPHMVFLNAYTFNGEQYRIHQKFLGIKKDTIYTGLPKEFWFQWEEPDQVKEAFTGTCIFNESDYQMLAEACKANNNTGEFIIEPYLENTIKKMKLYLVTGKTKKEIQLKENTVKRLLYKN